MKKSRTRSFIPVIATLTALAVLNSCGSGDDTKTVNSLSKKEFIKQADQICSKTEKRQLVLIGKFEEGKSPQESQASSPKAEEELVAFAGVPPVKQQLQELSQLPAPEGGSEQVDGYLKALETGLKTAENDPALLLSIDSDPFAKATSLAKAFGFKVCSGA